MNDVVDIEAAIGQHAVWMTHLRNAVLGAYSGMDREYIRADNQCEFGKWLYGSHLSAEQRVSEYFQAVQRLHAEFHQLAARVLDLAASGRMVEAYSPVSYTHLDVYKRQVVLSGPIGFHGHSLNTGFDFPPEFVIQEARNPWLGLALPLSGQGERIPRQIPGIDQPGKERIQNDNSPVSYTHLDVYKRQG